MSTGHFFGVTQAKTNGPRSDTDRSTLVNL